MKIGSFETENNVFLAPMAGVTDSPFRKICRQWGAGLVYTEMVSAKGLFYGDKKTSRLMLIDDEEHPCAIQIFGSDAEIMADIIPKVMEFSPDIIDINMGCPMAKIVNNGDGSALLKNPRKIGEIVRKVSDASPVPVTVKIRAGWDDNSINAAETAKIIEENGGAAITVHGRTRMRFYSGEADWNLIRGVKNAVSIPVIGNGDIASAPDAKKMFDYTGCDAVMIGRGAQGNPFIFRQTAEYLKNGRTDFFPSPELRLRQALEHLTMLVEQKGEFKGVMESRKHIAWYIKGLPLSSRIKSEVFKISDFDSMRRCLTEYIEKIQ